MRRGHALRFDALEAKQLLSAAHVAAAHPKPKAAPVAVPLVLNGTLAVDAKRASQTENIDGSWTTSTPVSGQLGALGQVRGVWNETVDMMGDVTGLDALRLRNAQGTLVIGFDNSAPGKPRPFGHGTVYIEDAQHLYTGTGAYTHGAEAGSIQIVSNARQTAIEDLVLHTRGT
jgi:hypothetical protein